MNFELHKDTALFIGAGFSKEMSMPLIKELTKELKDFLTIKKLTEINNAWNVSNNGVSSQVIADFSKALQNPEYHYENLIGWLQKRSKIN